MKRLQGPLGEGWERVTPEKSEESSKAFEGPRAKSPRGKNVRPNKFSDLGVKQRKNL